MSKFIDMERQELQDTQGGVWALAAAFALGAVAGAAAYRWGKDYPNWP